MLARLNRLFKKAPEETKAPSFAEPSKILDVEDGPIDDRVNLAHASGFHKVQHPPQLPTYLEQSAARDLYLCSEIAPFLIVDIVKQIANDYDQIRLLVFEIALRNRAWGSVRGNSVTLAEEPYRLDRTVATACMASFIKEKGGLGSATFDEGLDARVKKDAGMVAAIKASTPTLRKIEKAIRDELIRALLEGLKDGRSPPDYQRLKLKFTEIHKKVTAVEKQLNAEFDEAYRRQRATLNQ